MPRQLPAVETYSTDLADALTAATFEENRADVVTFNRLLLYVTPLYASSNQSLRGQPPSIVAARPDVSQSAVESHSIDWALFTEGQWNKFLDMRSNQLKALISEAVG